MKKFLILFLIIGENAIITSCTETSLAEVEEERTLRTFADDTTGGYPIDPPDLPPDNGN